LQVSKQQFARVRSYIEGAVKEGAKVLTGGTFPQQGELAGGYYVEPTVLQVTPNMTVWSVLLLF